jgi:hypothetical protein
VATGFGDAEIVAADAAGLTGAFTSGAFGGLQPTDKNSGKKIAAEMNCFIKMDLLLESRELASLVKSYR